MPLLSVHRYAPAIVFTRFLCSFEGLQVVHSLHVGAVCVNIIQTGAACVGICGLYLLLDIYV